MLDTLGAAASALGKLTLFGVDLFNNVIEGDQGEGNFPERIFDDLSGTDGADAIFGLRGVDRIDGGDGNDRIIGYESAFFILARAAGEPYIEDEVFDPEAFLADNAEVGLSGTTITTDEGSILFVGVHDTSAFDGFLLLG